ncbi:MAG: hypothetical protein ACE14P_14995 [Methanotrichaceae archaeon]
MNYSVEVMPPYENNSYTSYSVLINVSKVRAGIVIYDLKNPEDTNITPVVELYKNYTRNMSNSSLETTKIDGKDGVVIRYVDPRDNKQELQGIYWLDSHQVNNSAQSEGSIEVRLYATMPQNSPEDKAIAESIFDTIHIVKTEGQAVQTTQPAPANQPVQPPQTVVQAFKPMPYIDIKDQNVENNGGNAIIDAVFSNGPGWVVIYNERYVPYSTPVSSPIGYTRVDSGLTKGIKVKLNMALVTGKLYAVLFKDVGQVGAFEYPGPDFPLNPHAETIYSFNAKWPNPLDDFRIDWREHTSSHDPYWM